MAFKTSKFYDDYLEAQSRYNIVNPKDQSYQLTPQQLYASAGGYFRKRERTETTEKEFIDYAIRRTTYEGFVSKYMSKMGKDLFDNPFIRYRGTSYEFIDKDVYRDAKEILNLSDKQILNQLQIMTNKEIESISRIKSSLLNDEHINFSGNQERFEQLLETLTNLEKRGIKSMSTEEKYYLFGEIAALFPNYKNIVSYLLSPKENSLEVS